MEDVAQRRVVRVDLDLAGAVEQDVVLAQLLQPVLQPLHVVFELLERVQDPAVGSQAIVRHDLLERDQVADVEGAGVVGPVVGGVEVDDGALPADGAHELVHLRASQSVACAGAWNGEELTAVAIRALPCAGAPEHELSEGHVD